jgi:hypothetical protein
MTSYIALDLLKANYVRVVYCDLLAERMEVYMASNRFSSHSLLLVSPFIDLLGRDLAETKKEVSLSFPSPFVQHTQR